jgi:uncharacterized membrane protein
VQAKSVFDTRPRLLIALGIAVLAGFLLPHQWRLPVRSIAAWDVGAVVFLCLTVLMMNRSNHHTIRARAAVDNERRWQILLGVLTGIGISLLAIVYMLKDGKNLGTAVLTLHITLAVLTVICSWLLAHTMFALYYAHTYYLGQIKHPDAPTGLDFPEEKEPDYWDFIYFSFVIGMTSQVADVSINSRRFRKLCILHGILSFFFNTAIIAMSINLVAGLV